jgi:hypothetical protein
MIHSFSTVNSTYYIPDNQPIIVYVYIDSGHGGQMDDKTGTESDGKDEGMS